MPWVQVAGSNHPGLEGGPPAECDGCGFPIDDCKGEPIFDGKIFFSPRHGWRWGWYCQQCYEMCGGRLGVGSGQQYEWREE